LALCIAIPVIASGCNKDGGEPDEDITPRIVSGEENGEDYDVDVDLEEFPIVTTIPRETEVLEIVVTGADGAAVTDAFGNIETSVTFDTKSTPQATTTARPLSDGDVEKIVQAGTTSVTNVVAPSSVSGGNKFAYNTLNAKEKKLYDDILSGTETLMWRLRDYDNLPISEWSKVLGLVFNQEPQLFWMGPKSMSGSIFLNEYEPSKIASMQKQIDAVVNPILNDAKAKSTTYDKLKVFHDWLVLNCDFAGDDPYHSTIYGAFVMKKAQCAGYAKAMKYLCDKSGINSMVITGTNGKGTTHAWNVVDVDGAWYNIDVMWNDPVFSTPRQGYIRYTYFLVPDKWIHNNTHHDVNKALLSAGAISYFTPPASTETAKNYFTVNNMIYKDFASADAAIKAQIDKAIASKGHVVELRVESKQVYDEVYKNLKSYQTYAQSKSSNVRGLSDSCNAGMLSIQLNMLYD